jgi:hypothetical protein
VELVKLDGGEKEIACVLDVIVIDFVIETDSKVELPG